MGFCPGIENYSRHLDGRAPGEPPFTLLDYFPEDFLLVVDESHVTVPQIGGMYRGDRVAQGDAGRVRLPAAVGARQPAAQLRGVRGAHPAGGLRLRHAGRLGARARRRAGGRAAHPADRPDGSGGRACGRRGTRWTTCSTRSARASRPRERVLVTTLTKKMAEDLTDYFQDVGIRVRYIHSDIETIERVEIIRDLRRGDVRRPGRHQPAARGARPARGVAGGDPRRRQGGLPALGALADPDHRPRGAQRERHGDHVRRHGHRLDAEGDRRDEPPARRCRRSTTRARHHAADDPEGDRRSARRASARPTT